MIKHIIERYDIEQTICHNFTNTVHLSILYQFEIKIMYTL